MSAITLSETPIFATVKSDANAGREVEVVGKDDITPTAVADNRVFCEQIGNALLSLGTRETLACMARMMAAISQKENVDLEFDCDIGKVTVERKIVQLNG